MHREMCRDHGKVWWGWWSKARERVPLDIFGTLAKQALQAEALDVFLIDTGSESLFRAKCVKIINDTSGARIGSPEKDLTPSYYNLQDYLAWFCFSSIVDSSVEELKKHSYVNIPDLFLSGDNSFAHFDQKTVCSAQELILQDRSIWFVRPALELDATHEIHLLDAAVTQPEDFPQNFRSAKGKDFLWLSDLHFGHNEFPLKTGITSKALEVALENACNKLGLEIGGILVTGDCAWKAEKAEFDQTREFLERLLSVLRLKSYDLLVCPGNHDFSLEAGSAAAAIGAATLESTTNYRNFYRELFNRNPNKFCTSGRRFLLAESYPVEIVALNSLYAQQVQEFFQGFGLVGYEQLDFAAKQYRWETHSERRPFRILMLHHHLVPVTYIEEPKINGRYSLALDAEAVMRWATEHSVDLVLHGHMHQPSCVRLTRPVDFTSNQTSLVSEWPSLLVAGLGSTGVKHDHLGDIKKNMFGILRFQGATLNISMYEVHPTSTTYAIISKVTSTIL